MKTIRLGAIFFISLAHGSSFVNIQKTIPSIVCDIRYATPNNFTKMIVYPRSGCYARVAVVEALDAVQKELKPLGLGLKIFDAYRPHQYQELFWTIMPDNRYVADPKKGSKHNRGAAIDLTLINLADGKELSMPSEFDDFSQRAHRVYSRMEPEAAKNCQLLEDIMKEHGFTGAATEWWHFDYKDWEQYPISNISFDEIDAAQRKDEI